MRWAGEQGQDLQRVRSKVAFERLLARLFADSSGKWLLKGGYAMELRFPIARATQGLGFQMVRRRMKRSIPP